MDFRLSLKAFLRGLRLTDMNGHEKFAALAVFLASGRTGTELATREVQEQWRKSLMGQDYNPVFYERAQQEAWVDRVIGKKGIFVVNAAGLEHVAAFERASRVPGAGGLQKVGGLVVVNRKATHSFDKYLRKIFATATNEVLIADSYVDGTVFDTVLDAIRPAVPVKCLYGTAVGTFEAKALRFSKQWKQFSSRRYTSLHDRFMVVDNAGYVLGPSIKDAASNSPALVVELGPSERGLLKKFFYELWQNGKA